MQNNTIKEKYNKTEILYQYVVYVDSNLNFFIYFKYGMKSIFSDIKDKFLTSNFIIDLKRCYFVKNMSIKCLFKIWKLLCPLNLTCVAFTVADWGTHLVHAPLEILDPSLVRMGYRTFPLLRISRVDSVSASNSTFR